MNCYIRLNNGNYQVVDGNTNKAIATFVSEFDAHKFLQSYLNNVYGVQPPMQQPFLPMYQLPMTSFGIPMMMPQQQGYMPQQQPGYNMSPQQGYMQQPGYNMPQQQPGMMNYGQPNSGMMMQQPGSIAQPGNGPQQNGYPNGMENEQFNNSTGGYQQYPEGNDSNNGQKNQGIENFDDTTLTFDMSAFDEDKIGAIIQDNSLIINNTDDDSLGEVSLYGKKDKLRGDKKSKKSEDEALVNVSFRKEDDLDNIDKLEPKEVEAQINVIDDYDLDNMSSVVVSESPKQEVWADSVEETSDIEEENQNFNFEQEVEIEDIKEPQLNDQFNEVIDNNNRNNEEIDNASITSLYEKNLIPDDIIVPKKDDGLIDLGPVEEEDEIFSTPRRDAEQDDFENFSLSKSDKKTLKKRKKAEEASRKKYSKLLR